MSIPSANRRFPIAALLLLALTAALAGALRLYRTGDPLWLDELHTAWTASGGLGQVGPRAVVGNQSPAYFYLAWASVQLFGMSERAVRLPSLAAGTLLVPLVGLMVLRWTGSSIAALVAALLAALDRDLLFYGQEGRPYAAVQAVGLIQVLVFSALLTMQPHSRARWFAKPAVVRSVLVVSTVLLFYLHYTAGLLLAGELVCYFFLLRTRNWAPAYGWKSMALDTSLVLGMCVPAAPHLWAIGRQRDNWRMIVEAWPTPTMLRFAVVYLAWPLGLAAVVWLVRRGMGRRPLRVPMDPRLVALVVSWLVFPLAVAWLSTESGIAPLAKLRYVIVSSLAPIVIAGLCCAACPGGAARAIVALLVLAGAVWASDLPRQFHEDGRLVGDRNEDWPAVVGTINASAATRRWPVLLCPGLIEDGALAGAPGERFRQYCLFPITGIYKVERRGRRLVPLPTTRFERLSEGQRRLIVSRGGAWLIVRAQDPLASRISSAICRQLNRRGGKCRVEPRWTAGPVKLFRLVATRETPPIAAEPQPK